MENAGLKMENDRTECRDVKTTAGKRKTFVFPTTSRQETNKSSSPADNSEERHIRRRRLS